MSRFNNNINDDDDDDDDTNKRKIFPILTAKLRTAIEITRTPKSTQPKQKVTLYLWRADCEGIISS